MTEEKTTTPPPEKKVVGSEQPPNPVENEPPKPIEKDEERYPTGTIVTMIGLVLLQAGCLWKSLRPEHSRAIKKYPTLAIKKLKSKIGTKISGMVSKKLPSFH